MQQVQVLATMTYNTNPLRVCEAAVHRRVAASRRLQGDCIANPIQPEPASALTSRRAAAKSRRAREGVRV